MTNETLREGEKEWNDIWQNTGNEANGVLDKIAKTRELYLNLFSKIEEREKKLMGEVSNSIEKLMDKYDLTNDGSANSAFIADIELYRRSLLSNKEIK